MHTIEPNINVTEALVAISKAVGTHDTPGIYVGDVRGQVHYLASAGVFGSSATLDGKIQESDDNVTFTDVSPAISFTQLTAAGAAELKVRTRQVTKKYLRARYTVAVAAVVFGVTSVYEPTTVS